MRMYWRSSAMGWHGLLAVVMIWFGAHSSLANSVCVRCEGPVGVYSCSYAPGPSGRIPRKSDRALKFSCIQDVARQYQHASCSVLREQLGVCNGQVHMMSPGAPLATTSEPTPQSDVGAGKESAVAQNKQREPKTVVDMAKRTARNTQEQFDKSAKTVSKAARSTWRCISSLFSKC